MASAYERLGAICKMLAQQPNQSAEELKSKLHDYYETSESGSRMMRRDLKQLCKQQRVRLDKPGRPARFSLDKDFLERLSQEELREVIDLHYRSWRVPPNGLSPLVLSECLHRLASDLGDEQRFRIDLQPSEEEGRMREFNPVHLRQVFEAFALGKAVQIKYRNREGLVSTPLLHIQQLQLKNNVLRLGAVREQDRHDVAALRTYTLDNFIELAISECDCLHYPDLHFESAARIPILLRVGGYVADYLETNRLSDDQCLQLDPDNHGKSLVELSLPDDGQLLRRLLGWGANVEVLAPSALRHKVASQIAKMARVYGYPIPLPEAK